MTDATVVREPDSSLVTTLHITYALHAVGLAIGAFGTATVIGAFLFGWPSIIAVILNYVKRGDARGTWLESHFTWQIRTFWYAVLWAIVLACVNFVLMFLVIGFLTWPMSFYVLGVWAVYRITAGWLRLRDRRPIG
jgi:uncharacterized membrane protein